MTAAMEDLSRLVNHANGLVQQDDKKYAIQIQGNELSRARGGPRCMTMPLDRDDV